MIYPELYPQSFRIVLRCHLSYVLSASDRCCNQLVLHLFTLLNVCCEYKCEWLKKMFKSEKEKKKKG